MIKKIKGVAVLKDWMRWVDDKQYLGFYGLITVHQDKETVGFGVRGNNTNWFVKIKGATSEVIILGCQIRGFISASGNQKDSAYKMIP